MSTTGPATVSVADVGGTLDRHYPPAWAQEWDRVGLVLGEPGAPVRRVLCVVDCVPATVAEALATGADLILAHHPLLLRGVSSVAPTTYQGRIVHELIKNDVALFVAHTNADVASPGVSDALAARLGLTSLRPLHPPAAGSAAADDAAADDTAADDAAADDAGAGPGRGIGRIGRLARPMTLAQLVTHAAAVLPATSWGVRAAGDPDRTIRTVAVSGGSGDSYLADAAAAGVDAYLTSDLRHHPASEHLAAGGPALLDAAHWATERPWLDMVAEVLRRELSVDVVISDLDTDPWTVHARSAPSVPAGDTIRTKEAHL